ncbi:MAG: response regulator, partial [Actinobacteria bacterium]|nr:response regulator [Actinomycetota bacterium]
MPTVLVVDDEPDILEILQITLESAGHRVVTAADGAQALAAVEKEIPDAILLDVGMPNVDGWQVLEQIKASVAPELAAVPVIMVTAWASDEDRLRGGIEGAVEYVRKPFDPSRVVSILDELLAPGAPPEPELRKHVQQSSLERLARMERGLAGDTADGPRGHLTRLD